MLSFIARRILAVFDRRWDYDSAYAREVLAEAGFGALLPLDALARVSRYRRGIPASVYYASKVPAALSAGCGSCVQLTLRQAEAEGVSSATLRALVMGREDLLEPDERLAFAFARAMVAGEDADALRGALRERFGLRGLVSLAYGLAAAQAFPIVKTALGYGAACSLVRVAGDDLATAAAAPP